MRPSLEGKAQTGLEEAFRLTPAGLGEGDPRVQETVFAYQQQRPWSEEVLSYWTERGISSERLTTLLQEARHGVIQGKIQDVSFELWNDIGEAMDAYDSDQLPGVTVKLIKTTDPEKIARLKHGYELAKKRLGGLFVLTLVENLDLIVDGKKQTYPYAVIQQKARLVREVLTALADQKWDLIREGKTEQADQVERERLQKEQELEKAFIQLSEEMFARGVWDDDFTNWRNNYGFVEGSSQMMGFDGDRITEIEHFALHRFLGGDAASDQRVIGPAFSREHILEIFDQARGAAVFQPVPDLWDEEIQNAQRIALSRLLAAGVEEVELTMVSPDQVPGFDFTGTDTPELQRENVQALLAFLGVDPQGLVVNVGSGVRPLIFGDSSRRKPLNLDTQPFARPAADRIGAEYADADVIQIAGAVQPSRTGTLPEVLLFYRMGSFVDIYHGHNPQEFWQAAWKLVPPGGWILLVNPPFPEFPIAALDYSYRQILSSLPVGEKPSEVRVVTLDGTLPNALTIAIRKSTAGVEEVLSGEEAQQRFAGIRQSFAQGTPVREVSRHLSETMMGLLRHVEEAAVINLQTKIPVLIDFGEETSRVIAYALGDPNLRKHPQTKYAGKDYFIVTTGSLGRQDDFALGSDADFVVFPSNPESIAYAQALQAEMTEVLGKTLTDNAMDFKVDERLTTKHDFQIPAEQVPEKLLVTTLLIYDSAASQVLPTPAITSYVFRDMTFLSGNREGFDRLSEIIAPVLYPYDGSGKGVNARGLELIEKLQEDLREFGKVSMDTSRPERIDLKERLLRPVQMVVWLMRARQGVRSASVFDALREMEARGIGRSEELARAYEFMLRVRNASYGENQQPIVAQRMGLSLPDFLQQFKTHADAIRSIIPQQLAAGVEEPVDGWGPEIEEVLDAYAANPGRGAALLRFQGHGSGDATQVLGFFDRVVEGLNRRGMSKDQMKLLALTEQGPPFYVLSAPVVTRILKSDLYATLRAYYIGGGADPLPLKQAVPDAVLREEFQSVYDELSPRWQAFGNAERTKDPNSRPFLSVLSRGLADRNIPQEWEFTTPSAWLLGRFLDSEINAALRETHEKGDEQAALHHLQVHQDLFEWVSRERNYSIARQEEALLRDPRYQGYLIVGSFGADHQEMASMIQYGSVPHAASIPYSGLDYPEPVSELRRIRANRQGEPLSQEESRRAQRIVPFMQMLSLLEDFQPQELWKRTFSQPMVLAVRRMLDQLSDAQLHQLNQAIFGYVRRMAWPNGAVLPVGVLPSARRYMIYAWLNSNGLVPEEVKASLPPDVREMTEETVWQTYLATHGSSAGVEEESSRRQIPFVEGIQLWVTEGLFAPDQSVRLFLDLFKQHPDWLEGDILELGTGTGAISIFLARKGRRAVGLDILPEAVADAEFNKTNQPDEVQQRLTFGVSDLYQNLAQVTGDPSRRFDAMFSLLPIFIRDFSTSKGESFKTAAYAGPTGEVVRRAVEGLPQVLKPGKSGFFLAAAQNENDVHLDVLGPDNLRAMLPGPDWRLEGTGVTLTITEHHHWAGDTLDDDIIYEMFRITPPLSAYAGVEERVRAKEETITVRVADQLVEGIVAHSPGIRDLQASLRDSGIQVKEVKNPQESGELLRGELVGLLILAPEDSETGDWRGGTAVPTVVMPARVAAGLTERELAALAVEARARGGILHINDITREGAEEQVLVLRMA
ncbi:MAG: methyltransferase domain-containing protein [Candidatus Omnitrophota bacterium]|nr:methyltransferase domain-containing protein [Candidatus Omnitrophota bacterium]